MALADEKVTPPSRLSVVGRPAIAVLKAQTPISSATAVAAKPPAARRFSLRRGRNGTATITRLSRYWGRIATAAAPSAPASTPSRRAGRPTLRCAAYPSQSEARRKARPGDSERK
jgi:hypothetical protein